MRRAFVAVATSLALTAIISTGSAGAAGVTKPGATLRHDRLVTVSAARTLDVVALRHGVTPVRLREQWQRVAICEVDGDWSMTGPIYSGIGFANATWSQYGGERYAPRAGDATRDQQIVIAMRVTGGRVPDQDGCTPTGW